jgi:Kdo2-lipid IVA lauroyltransferase/acyltransferase
MESSTAILSGAPRRRGICSTPPPLIARLRAVKAFRHYLEYLFAKSALGSLKVLPPRAALRLADGAGWLTYFFSRRCRTISHENLRCSGLVQNEHEIRPLAIRSLQSFTRMLAETTLLRDRIQPDNWRDYVQVNLSPGLEAVLKNPRHGLIAVSAHLGNWEVAARAFSMIKPVSMIYRPLRNPRLDRDLTRGRAGSQLSLISKFDVGPRRLLEVLANGGILALMIDQRMPTNSERLQVDFFGRPAWTTRSVAMMHLTTRVPIVVACAVRTGTLQFELNLVGPLTFPRSGNRETDVRTITEAVTAEVERQIRRHPDQYMWSHRRWCDPNAEL